MRGVVSIVKITVKYSYKRPVFLKLFKHDFSPKTIVDRKGMSYRLRSEGAH